jgi:hypothetical protein
MYQFILAMAALCLGFSSCSQPAKDVVLAIIFVLALVVTFGVRP